MAGVIKGNETVKIAPFKDEKDFLADATVKSIHLDLTEEKETPKLEMASPGNVVGISLRLEEKYINEIKRRQQIPYIIASETATVCFGDVICVQIPKSEIDEEYSIFEFPIEMHLLLNGKYLPSYFLGYYSPIEAGPAYCLKINTSIAAVKDKDGKIIGINPLIIKESLKYYHKRKEKKMDIKIFSVKIPIVGLGFLKEFKFSFPNKYRDVIPNELLSYVKEQNDTIALILDNKLYFEFKEKLINIQRILKEQFTYSFKPMVEIDEKCIAK